MGYTHYWDRHAEFNKEAFTRLVDEITNTILPALPSESTSAGGYYKGEPIVLAGWDGKGEPTFNYDEIRFNGTDEGDMGHETFTLERVRTPLRDWQGNTWERPKNGYFYDFCKTARKPYDFVVCLVLIAARYHLVDSITLDSDGGEDDWAPALDFYLNLFPGRREEMTGVPS